MRFFDARCDTRVGVPTVAIQRTNRLGSLGGARNRRHGPEVVDNGATELPLRQPQHATKLKSIDRMQWKEHVPQSDASSRRLLKDLHILESVEACEVSECLAHVAHRQRFADGSLK